MLHSTRIAKSFNLQGMLNNENLFNYEKILLFQRNILLQKDFPPVVDELLSEERLECNFSYNVKAISTFPSRINLIIGLGLFILGILTPCLQTALAYLYFKKGHIWSRVLNSALLGEAQIRDRAYLPNWISNLRNILRSRVMY